MEYYLLIDGATTGPFTMEELRGRFAAGELVLETLFWSHGMPEWQPLWLMAAALEDEGYRPAEAAKTEVIPVKDSDASLTAAKAAKAAKAGYPGAYWLVAGPVLALVVYAMYLATNEFFSK